MKILLTGAAGFIGMQVALKPPQKPESTWIREFHSTEFLREENQIQ